MTIEMDGKSRVASRKSRDALLPLNWYLANTWPAGKPKIILINVTKIAMMRELIIDGYTSVPLIVYMDWSMTEESSGTTPVNK
jgi:hypothetical protein